MSVQTFDLRLSARRRSELGRFLTTLKGLRAEATQPPPKNPRVREHDQAIPSIRTPNQYNGAFLERYEQDACDCAPCIAKRTKDAGEFEESEHPRDPAGKFAIVEPGTAPIPEGMMRRFHYTPIENVESILKTGIGVQYSHGRAVADPVAVWSTPEYPYKSKGDIPDDKAVIEFFHDPHNYNLNPIATHVNVPSENIVAVHESWHEIYNSVKNGDIPIKNLRRVAKPGRGNEKYIKALEQLRKEGYTGDAGDPATQLYSPYYAPVYKEVKPGVLPFEKIWEQALAFPERYELAPQQLQPLQTEDQDQGDTLNVSIPLMIRLLEYAREDAKTDEDLHVLVEKLYAKSANGSAPLDMQDYLGKTVQSAVKDDAFVESQHPRGQPENKGEFAKVPVSTKAEPPIPLSSSAVGVGKTVVALNPTSNELNSLFKEEEGPYRAVYEPGKFAIWPAEEMLHQPVMRALRMDDKAKRYFVYKSTRGMQRPTEFKMGSWYVTIIDDMGIRGVPAKFVPEPMRKAFGIHVRDAAFEESKHPRDDIGQFAKTEVIGNEVFVNPYPSVIKHVLNEQQGYSGKKLIRVLGRGPNIALGTREDHTHGALFEKLQENVHPMVGRGSVRNIFDLQQYDRLVISAYNEAYWQQYGLDKNPKAALLHKYKIGDYRIGVRRAGDEHSGPLPESEWPLGLKQALGIPWSTSKDSAFVETEHPRGQPENAGEFVKKGLGYVRQHPGTARPAPVGGGRRSVNPALIGQQSRPDTRRSSTVSPGSGGAVTFKRNVASTEFYNSISTATKASNVGAAVHVYRPEEYAAMRCFLTADKTAGFALKGDDIVSVFKHPDSPHKKVAIAALAQAVKEGGRRLDCFDTVLPGFYSNNHFRAVARIKFNDEYAPENWDYQRMAPFNQGRPDVVFMVYDPNSTELYKPGDGELVDDYDQAEAIQKSLVHQTKPPVPTQVAAEAGGAKLTPKNGLVPALPDRSDFPEHIKKLVVPPAWTNVHYNPDPNGDLLVVGRDAAGRRQPIYNAEFLKNNALSKFGRVRELEDLFAGITDKNERNRESVLPVVRDIADVTKLIMETGIRPGSDKETGAKVKAYGATTLLGKHVIADASGVSLKFTGKKGVVLTIPLTDQSTADMLRRRALVTGPEDKLFPTANDKRLQGYVKQLSTGVIKPKDFRTYVATSTALGAIRSLPAPANQIQYKKQVHEVAKRVSRKLGNTPTVALASYINPVVFAEWRAGLQDQATHAGDQEANIAAAIGTTAAAYAPAVIGRTMMEQPNVMTRGSRAISLNPFSAAPTQSQALENSIMGRPANAGSFGSVPASSPTPPPPTSTPSSPAPVSISPVSTSSSSTSSPVSSPTPPTSTPPSGG